MRRAKAPDERCKWLIYSTNKNTLNNIERTLAGQISVIKAFTWGKTKEGHAYWSDFHKEPHQEGWYRLREMVEELAVPITPINKEDWL